jgi:hypothetical protein
MLIVKFEPCILLVFKVLMFFWLFRFVIIFLFGLFFAIEFVKRI